MHESVPTFTNGQPIGWQVSGGRSNGDGTYTIAASVLCGPAS